MSEVLLDEAEAFVFDLWSKQGFLVRQAIFWDASGKALISAFISAVTRDSSLKELRDAAKDVRPVRVFFFSESRATVPDGRPTDVILVEVGDVELEVYAQRIYSAEKAPQRLAEETMALRESPLHGVLVDKMPAALNPRKPWWKLWGN